MRMLKREDAMTFTKTYRSSEQEIDIQAMWEEMGVYHFEGKSGRPVYSIDTPPATVSGELHLGHVYSYSQTDFFARFWRMNGYDVFYPMGFDDNGLPTERLVERTLEIDARKIGLETFRKKCMEVSEEFEKEYQQLWQRIGLSVDWRHTYRTIDESTIKISQASFLDLYRKGFLYRELAPSIWCPECKTALAQADLNDIQREKDFYTLAFQLEDGRALPIATTRPELLSACVAVFIHPKDKQHKPLVGQKVRVPLFGQHVRIYEDAGVDQSKGTGVVMCCTFGDAADIEWWRIHDLPLKMVIDENGCLTSEAGRFAGLHVDQARPKMIEALNEEGLILDRENTHQSVRVHERCDTPIEFLVTKQWFIKILDKKEDLLKAAERIHWHPEHMKIRYTQWVENLNWDWLISRQRFFGVPFPVWYCAHCGETIVAEEGQLPVDPNNDQPPRACKCGSEEFFPEQDVMDTWATSSMTPQIACDWLEDEDFYQKTFPMSLRPQAHEIIRTWAFYTIVKSMYHFQEIPWKDVAISGWGLAPAGMGKISKSRGGGPISPDEMIDRYSADAVRYWAASTGLGKDSIISEEKIRVGSRLVTKIWNVARFSGKFLIGYRPPQTLQVLLPIDRWILSRLQHVVNISTEAFQSYDYATALSETETYFWHDLADNWLEMAKYRLYGESSEGQESARYCLYHILLNSLRLYAPILPHVTDQIFQKLFAEAEQQVSIHLGGWPGEAMFEVNEEWEAFGDVMVQVVTAVRRYKSENHLPLSTELSRLYINVKSPSIVEMLETSQMDLRSATRAQTIKIHEKIPKNAKILVADEQFQVAITL
jgi:valyl-tRNA synthetase